MNSAVAEWVVLWVINLKIVRLNPALVHGCRQQITQFIHETQLICVNKSPSQGQGCHGFRDLTGSNSTQSPPTKT